MIRGIARAFGRRTHLSGGAPADAEQVSQSLDALDVGQPRHRRVALLPPSALGIAPPKLTRVDLTEATKPGDLAWEAGERDEACKIYEGLAKRYPTQPLPVVKLMHAYRVMHENRSFKQAAARLASLLPNPKAKAAAFLALFGDRPEDPSHTLLHLHLYEALELGEAHVLGRRAIVSLLLDGRCSGMSLLHYAVNVGADEDLDAVLRLARQVTTAPELVESFAEALTVAEALYHGDKLEAMLRSGLLPTPEHLDSLVDTALSQSYGARLQLLFETVLPRTYTRGVDGVARNLAQLLLLASCPDWAFARRVKILATNQCLLGPVPGGDGVLVMAIMRSGRALAAVLDHGLNLEARDPQSGNTPLIEAAARNACDCVGVLLGRGASATAVNDAGLNAVDMARLLGLREVERQIVHFPAQQHFERLLRVLWGDDPYHDTLQTLRTELYSLDGEHTNSFLNYAPPLLGLGALPDNFAMGEPWTMKTMRAKRLPVLQFVDRQPTHWRYIARKLVMLASKLGTTQWQGLTELVDGLKEPVWIDDCLRLLLGEEGLPPAQYRAVANSISGAAYRQPPDIRARIIRTAVAVRREYGRSGSASLDWLNELPLRGFDARAYWSVMWDFALCDAKRGDCAKLAQFVRDDVDTKNKMGLRLSLRERLFRIEKFGESLCVDSARPNPGSADASHARGKDAEMSRVLTETCAAAEATEARPWTDLADARCRIALGKCINFFGSASEIDNVEAEQAPKVFRLLQIIFGDSQVRFLLGRDDAGSQVRRLLLRWHPDKVGPDRVDVAADMTTLLLALRDLMEKSDLRTQLIAHLNAMHPQGWRLPA